MSRKHPVIAVTGSSGAGTSTVKRAFENIFRREEMSAAIIEGDSLHSLDRLAFRVAVAEAAKAGNHSFSHFGPEANHFDKIEETFRVYSETGTCKRRYYVHSEDEAILHNKHFGLTDLKPGTFTPWEDVEPNSDLLFYEGLHGLAIDGILTLANTLIWVSVWFRWLILSGYRKFTVTKKSGAILPRQRLIQFCAACLIM